MVCQCDSPPRAGSTPFAMFACRRDSRTSSTRVSARTPPPPRAGSNGFSPARDQHTAALHSVASPPWFGAAVTAVTGAQQPLDRCQHQREGLGAPQPPWWHQQQAMTGGLALVLAKSAGTPHAGPYPHARAPDTPQEPAGTPVPQRATLASHMAASALVHQPRSALLRCVSEPECTCSSAAGA